MAEQPFTNLDFQNVKTKLKEYLKAQDQFKDYDFEGSNINVLLDILSYNTFQNNYYTNMAISEMFLDSAQVRDSVISHAKELNYLPRSRRSPRATVALEFFPTNSPASIVIPEKTHFTAKCGTTTYNFWTDEAYSVTPLNGAYAISDVELYQGKYIEEFYSVNGTSDQRFVINNDTVDTESIRVFISESSESQEEIEYNYRANLYDVEIEDNVFYLQPYRDNLYEIVFGQNNFGKQPVNGNIIRVEYRITVGEEANGINTIQLKEPIQNISSTIALQQSSIGGAERESINSIRFFAPKSIQIQERAVTENDYVVLMRNQFPEIRSIAVYGGEELSPPQYGKVVLALYISDEENISQANRDNYLNYLKDRTATTVEPIFVPAKFMYLDVSSNVYYDINATNKNPSSIESLVRNTILSYSTDNLEEFRKNFRYSNLVANIDNEDPSIVSNDTNIRGVISISPSRGQRESFVLQYGNEFDVDKTFVASNLNDYRASVTSDSFTYNGKTVFLQDNGSGRLDLLEAVNNNISVIQINVGSVDYKTGDVNIKAIAIEDYQGDYINIYAQIKNQTIIAPKDRILRIRDEDISVSAIGRRR